MTKHILSVLVENKFGVLARISGLIAGRGFNIDSLAVGETEDPTVSRMTIVVDGDNKVLEQVKKQLNRLVDVISIQDLTRGEYLERELILAKVSVTAKTRPEVVDIARTLQAEVADVGVKTLTVVLVGNTTKVKTLLDLMAPYGLREVVRTGRVAIGRDGAANAG
ncbi:MAG: acetolactate synthase small subunit [Candidatus Omnitrophica bacterium CG11_big_fil_rev_8_21_14_0_20_64_10]|nr:MAG: acetolactate synthase small subunit [Candidatus Omnitrophica bacterium CG11_big_fil_rev_8_21_14_0_20_64_10]